MTAPSVTELLLALALRRGLALTGYAPGAGLVVHLPDGATFLDGVLASLLVARSEDVAAILAAEGAAELVAELAASGIGDEPGADP